MFNYVIESFPPKKRCYIYLYALLRNTLKLRYIYSLRIYPRKDQTTPLQFLNIEFGHLQTLQSKFIGSIT